MVLCNGEIFCTVSGATAFSKPFGRAGPQYILFPFKNPFGVREHLFISSYWNIIFKVVVCFYFFKRMLFTKDGIRCICNYSIKNKLLAFRSIIPVFVYHLYILLKVNIFEIIVFWLLK